MAKNKPGRQHYVPKMLLKHFAVENVLYVYDKTKNQTETRSPKGVFWLRNQNTKHVDGREWGDWSAEEKLGDIEDATTPIFDRIVANVNDEIALTLSKSDRTTCKRFFVYMVHRNPARSLEMFREMGVDDIIYDAVCKTLASVGAPIPSRRLFDTAPGFEEVRRKQMHNTRAGFAAGLPPRLDNSIEDLVVKTGLGIGTTEGKGDRFIIGDCGVTRNEGYGGRHFSWLPIAPNVAISLEPYVNQLTLTELDADQVSTINLATWNQSDIIVARDQADLNELMTTHVNS